MDRLEKLSRSVTAAAKKRALDSMNVSANDYITTNEFFALIGNTANLDDLRKESKIPFTPLDTPNGLPKLWPKVKAETFARRLHVLNEKAPAPGLNVEDALTALGRALIRQIREAISDEIAIQAQRYQTFASEPSRPEIEAKPELKQGSLMASRKQAALMLGCGVSTIMRFEKENASWPIPIRLGSRVMYYRAAIEEFLNGEYMKANRERLKSAPLPGGANRDDA